MKTAGVSGTREVSSEVTKENGIITATKVVQTVVTAEPQNQIALKGLTVQVIPSMLWHISEEIYPVLQPVSTATFPQTGRKR